MPAEGLDWVGRDKVLRFEEIARLVRILASMGVHRVRLTGGEPTLRRDLVELVEMLAAIPEIDDLSMTTNGHILEKVAPSLARAGLNRINVSLDTLDPEHFRKVTRGGDLTRVMAGIEAARAHGMAPIKINAVMVAGENEDQLDRLVDAFSSHASDTEVRFIEAMPFGDARKRLHLSVAEMRKRLSERYTMQPDSAASGGGPATMWRLEESGLRVGFISPITEHFCESCNRLRLMVDGHLRTCLSREPLPSLRELIRTGAPDQVLETRIREQVWGKVAGHEAHLGTGWKAFEGEMSRIGG